MSLPQSLGRASNRFLPNITWSKCGWKCWKQVTGRDFLYFPSPRGCTLENDYNLKVGKLLVNDFITEKMLNIVIFLNQVIKVQ